MKVEYKKLLEELGVRGMLSAYETYPWLHYDDDQEITCSAEVRIGPSAQDVEAEIQFLYDDPEAAGKDNPEQILLMRFGPTHGHLWSPTHMRVRGTDYVNQIPRWEEKGCSFFRACIQSLQMGELPDIDKLIKKELPDDDGGQVGGGRIGRKAPKANRNMLMGMKK